MSWLLKPLQSKDSDAPNHYPQSNSPDISPSSNLSGVKEDLSVFTEAIGRQIRGVAAFLAPPAVAPAGTGDDAVEDESSSQTMIGIQKDLVEIGGRFKNGLSLLSSNKAVSGFSKFASSLLRLEGDENDAVDEVPVITREVVDFVNEISRRPECWTDFPMSLDDEFDMSDAQIDHASAVEELVPSLESLRRGLCSNMVDGKFWMIYFILLLPRLNRRDFELLSSAKIVEARNALLQKLQKRSDMVNDYDPDTPRDGSKSIKTQGSNITSKEKMVLSDNVTSSKAVRVSEQNSVQRFETDIDKVPSFDVQITIGQEDDVSFSDLEDEDNDLSGRFWSSKLAQDTGASFTDGTSDWVQLSSENRGSPRKSGQSNSREKDSSGEDSSDWLNVDDFD